MVRRTGSPVEVLRGVRGLERLRLRTAEPGLVLGEDQRGDHISLRLFRPTHTRVLLLGKPRLTKLIAVRALALGAVLSLRSTQPRGWEPVLRCAEELDRPGSMMFGGPLRPRLTIAEDLPGEPRDVPAEPWSTLLDTRSPVAEQVADPTDADLVLAAKLTPEQGARLGAALGLPQDRTQLFSELPADCVTVVDRHESRAVSVRVSPTLAEQSIIG